MSTQLAWAVTEPRGIIVPGTVRALRRETVEAARDYAPARIQHGRWEWLKRHGWRIVRVRMEVA